MDWNTAGSSDDTEDMGKCDSGMRVTLSFLDKGWRHRCSGLLRGTLLWGHRKVHPLVLGKGDYFPCLVCGAPKSILNPHANAFLLSLFLSSLHSYLIPFLSHSSPLSLPSFTLLPSLIPSSSLPNYLGSSSGNHVLGSGWPLLSLLPRVAWHVPVYPVSVSLHCSPEHSKRYFSSCCNKGLFRNCKHNLFT